MGKKNLGARGVEASRLYLERRGYDIAEINYECEFGEMEIIAWDDDTLVFIEVRTRKMSDRGMPLETKPSKKKRQRLELIAMSYLAGTDTVDHPVRFDRVDIGMLASDRALLRHHINCMVD